MAATSVPLKAGNFKEPITVTAGYCGKRTSATGNCISPPPPDMASVKPARNAATQRITISVVISIFVQHAEEFTPGTYLILILFCQHTAQLVDMRKIMH